LPGREQPARGSRLQRRHRQRRRRLHRLRRRRRRFGGSGLHRQALPHHREAQQALRRGPRARAGGSVAAVADPQTAAELTELEEPMDRRTIVRCALGAALSTLALGWFCASAARAALLSYSATFTVEAGNVGQFQKSTVGTLNVTRGADGTLLSFTLPP